MLYPHDHLRPHLVEVLKEDYDHQVFYAMEGGLPMQFSYLDKDKNTLPVGLFTRFRFPQKGQGTLRVTLKHQPGVKNNSEAPGETDVEVRLPVVVE